MASVVIEDVSGFLTDLRQAAGDRGVPIFDGVVHIPADHVWVEWSQRMTADEVVDLAHTVAALWLTVSIDDTGRSATVVCSAGQYTYSYTVMDWVLTRRPQFERQLFQDVRIRRTVDQREDIRSFVSIVHEYCDDHDQALSQTFRDEQLTWLHQQVYDRATRRRRQRYEQAQQIVGRELLQAVLNHAQSAGMVISHQPVQSELEYGLQQWFQAYSGGFVLTKAMLKSLVDTIYAYYASMYSSAAQLAYHQHQHNRQAQRGSQTKG